MDRFWNKVTKTDDCWLWIAAKSPLGYGRFLLDGKNRYAHKIAWEWENGPIASVWEDGDRPVLDHLCRNPSCVRPDHMELVTHSENIRRGRNTHREKTECRNGHPFDEANTYMWRGERRCRACVREAGRRRDAKARQHHAPPP